MMAARKAGSCMNEHLVGKAPEEERDDDGAPQLGHDVEEAEGPVAQDGDGAHEAHTQRLQQLLREGCNRPHHNA